MSANADKKNMKEVFETTDALCNYLWSGLPRNQLLANKVWLRRTHYMITKEVFGCIHPKDLFSRRRERFCIEIKN